MSKNTIVVFLLMFGVFCGCKKKEHTGQIQNSAITEKYVDVKEGLNVRETPELTGKKVTTLANGTKVTVLETKPESFNVGSVSGSWTKVSNGKIQGWAFGGFLNNTAPVSDDICDAYIRDVEQRWSTCMAEPNSTEGMGEGSPKYYDCMDIEHASVNEMAQKCPPDHAKPNFPHY